MADSDYTRWTREALIKKVKWLEDQLKQTGNLPKPPTVPEIPAETQSEASKKKDEKEKKKKKKKSEPAKYSTRLIALKFAYLGKNYNGFEYQTNGALATIEEELWKALTKSCLIRPDRPEEINFAPFEYSKCGRTDRGVSAFGQVISIRVRSNRPVPKEVTEEVEGEGEKMDVDTKEGGPEKQEETKDKKNVPKPEWDPIKDEIQYCKVLNRLLPPDIRVLAWCADPPEGFTARFSCRERQYRYFFTQPAFSPSPEAVSQTKPGAVKEGWLDIEAMRKAAKMYEGLHDFRNFCKVDMGKQITNFQRRIFESDIVEVKDVESALPYLNRPEFRDQGVVAERLPKVYYFHVRGSAFLWHQIRHMVAVLFLVAQGLEKPEIVSELLDIEKYPRRPNYIIADDSPLVLWDCIFPELEEHGALPEYDPEVYDLNMKDAVNWMYVGEDDPTNLHGNVGLMNQLWEFWREKKMDELLANRLLDMVSKRVDPSKLAVVPSSSGKKTKEEPPKVFLGGHQGTNMGKYIPVAKKQLLPSPEEVNDTYAQKHGFASAEEMAQTTNWRTVIKANKKAGRMDVDTPER